MATITNITWVFLAIATLFYAGLIIKPLLKMKFCTICLAVSLTWLSLLILRQLGLFENDLILAMLLGQSVVGGYYLWERRAKTNALIFRLPVLLTLTFGAWTLLRLDLDPTLMVIVTIVWIIHGLLHYYRAHDGVKTYVDKIIACCSKW